MPWHGGTPPQQVRLVRPCGSVPCSRCPPGQTPSPGWPVLIVGTAPFQPACGKSMETRGTYHTDGCSDTNACTWTCARQGRGRDGTGSQPAGEPQHPASHQWQAKSPCLTAPCYSRQWERCQRLAGPSGSRQPMPRTAITGKMGPDQHRGNNVSPVARSRGEGRAGSASSRRAACRSQQCLEGAKALTCRPA